MMKIKTLVACLDNNIAPKNLQENYDNCGLIVGNPEETLTGILTTLDVNYKVVDEAIQKNCNLIIAHHPIIFFGLKTMVDSIHNQNIIMHAIKNGISIYAAHTSLDNVFENSINQSIAKKIGLKNIEPLREIATPEYCSNTTGSGAIGVLENPEFIIEFIYGLKKKLGINGAIRFSDIVTNYKINKIAICTGAGFFMAKEAIKKGAELFITSDLTYHNFFDEKNIILADIGHYESEKHSSEVIYSLVKNFLTKHSEILKSETIKEKIFISEVDTNPVAYAF